MTRRGNGCSQSEDGLTDLQLRIIEFRAEIERILRLSDSVVVPRQNQPETEEQVFRLISYVAINWSKLFFESLDEISTGLSQTTGTRLSKSEAIERLSVLLAAANDQESKDGIATDATFAESNPSPLDLLCRPFLLSWISSPTLAKVKQLALVDCDWEVWIDWLHARFSGHYAERATEARRVELLEHFGHRGSRSINRTLRIERDQKFENWVQVAGFSDPRMANTGVTVLHPTKLPTSFLKSLADPIAVLGRQSKLTVTSAICLEDAQNSLFSREIVNNQLAAISTLLKGLSPRAPSGLRKALRSYERELRTKGNGPSIGLLNLSELVLCGFQPLAAYGKDGHSERLDEQFQKFFENHERLRSCFPHEYYLQRFFGELRVNEPSIALERIVKPLETVKSDAKRMYESGYATQRFLSVIQSMHRAALTQLARNHSMIDNPSVAQGNNERSGKLNLQASRSGPTSVLLFCICFLANLENLLDHEVPTQLRTEVESLSLHTTEALSQISGLIERD